MQIDAGGHYLHEHPTSASSWKEKSMQAIINHPNNFATRIHMCAYGMKIPDNTIMGIILCINQQNSWLTHH